MRLGSFECCGVGPASTCVLDAPLRAQSLLDRIYVSSRSQKGTARLQERARKGRHAVQRVEGKRRRNGRSVYKFFIEINRTRVVP